jgi:sigma-B regulation protein RsbU (phosphoserine phosphatase)
VADVADKGMGAALYMALSRTLIRSYGAEYPTQPELVLSSTNRRILTDTRANMFVTVFYGILDPEAGTLTYANAGHNPPLLLGASGDAPAQRLRRTGMALGVIQEATWTQKRLRLAPGDTLVLYSDGITEAQNRHEVFFGEERLLDVAQAKVGSSAGGLRDALLAEVHHFVGETTQFDDITLMVLVRDSSAHPGPRPTA